MDSVKSGIVCGKKRMWQKHTKRGGLKISFFFPSLELKKYIRAVIIFAEVIKY